MELFSALGFRWNRLAVPAAVILVFGGFGVSIYGVAHRVDAALALEKSAIEQDPSTLGLVKLTSNPPADGGAKTTAIDIWAAVYLNAKGTTFSDVKLTALAESDSNTAVAVDLTPMVAKAGAVDAQTFVFSVPNKSNHVRVCLTAVHPTIKERYTANWSYRIEQTGDMVNLTKSRAAWMEKSTPTDCSADVKSSRVDKALVRATHPSAG